jgi:hypothetical protein
MREYKYLPLGEIRKHEAEMQRLKVSEVARSPRGFLTAYKRAKGNPDKLSEHWKVKRNGFIKRHMAQYNVDKGHRRKLALEAWAYEPK